MFNSGVLELVGSEEEGIKKIEEIRKECEENMEKIISQVPVLSQKEALEKAVLIIQKILSIPKISQGYIEADPGHAVGHLVSDYLHSLILGKNLDISPQEILPGIIAGALHDIGCIVVPRYAEVSAPMRHAEIGGLMLYKIFEKDSFGLNRATQLAIIYAVMAHTNYLKSVEIKDSNGLVKYIIRPYLDSFKNGQPIMSVYFARWVDRLHLNGPVYPPRHYLTLVSDHKDFTSDQDFYVVKYENAMRPLLRPMEEKKNDPCGQTFLEHLEMFCSTQNNDSPYGKFDKGKMIEIRDVYKKELKEIIKSIVEKSNPNIDVEKVNEQWTAFLKKNCEPTPRGIQVADQLSRMFLKLSTESRIAWANGFEMCLEKYAKWAERNLIFLSLLPSEWLELPGITKDIREIISLEKNY